MMMMKSPVILVACTLLFSFVAVVASQNSFGPNECCFHFIKTRVPKKNVVDYKYTHIRCPMEGLLFKMKTGAEICADPSMEWVQKIIQAKDKVEAKNVTSPALRESE